MNEWEHRFWSKVKKTSSCWLWTGGCSGNGYGNFHLNGRQVKPHRIAYTLMLGDIPSGLVIDHLCRNTKCVNPSHLRTVTTRINTLAGIGPTAINATKTHCAKGHKYSPLTTHIKPDGARGCRICNCRKTQRQRREGVIKAKTSRRYSIVPTICNSCGDEWTAHPGRIPKWCQVCGEPSVAQRIVAERSKG